MVTLPQQAGTQERPQQPKGVYMRRKRKARLPELVVGPRSLIPSALRVVVKLFEGAKSRRGEFRTFVLATLACCIGTALANHL